MSEFKNLINVVIRKLGKLVHKQNCSLVGRRCRDRMVVGFTTIYAISAYHH